jgi:hypothetical protein
MRIVSAHRRKRQALFAYLTLVRTRLPHTRLTQRKESKNETVGGANR